MAATPEQDPDPSDAEDEWYDSPGGVDLRGRGRWTAEFREDLARYAAHHRGRRWLPLLVEQGAWALLQYRVASAVYRSRSPLRPLGMVAAVASQKLVEVITNIRLPPQCDLAPGQYIGHFGPTLVHEDVVMGPGCNISQGVSIGISGRGSRRGTPRIGSRVYLCAGAVVAGPVSVGDDVVVAANAVVTADVPPGSTAMGNPARVMPGFGSVGMGLHQRPRPGPRRAGVNRR